MKSANPTCNSINITWSAPNYTGGVPLERYTVRWSGRGSPLMTDGPDVTAVTVTPLSPNTSYTISVTAVNAIGEGQGSEQLKVITLPQGWWNIMNYILCVSLSIRELVTICSK